MLANILSTIAIILSLVSIVVTWWIAQNQGNIERRRNTLNLHERFSGDEFDKIRWVVYDVVEDWRHGGQRGSAMVEYFHNPDNVPSQQLPTGAQEVIQLLYFFADLNTYIDAQLVDEKLAARLFAESQYFWFADFIEVLRNVTLQRQSNRWIRWVVETKALEEKFRRR